MKKNVSTKNAVFTSLIIFFITLEILIAINLVLSQKELQVSRQKLSNALIDLQSEIGYVGLIHNFKNHVLRPGQLVYGESAKKNYNNAILLIDQIEHESQILGLDLHLEYTRNMVEDYGKRIDIVSALIEKGMSVRQIDQIVQYDDRLPHGEIEQVLHQLVASLENRMSNLLYRNLNYGLFILIALIVTLALTIRFFFREQQYALLKSEQINMELNRHKNDLIRSQKSMLSVIDDLNIEKARANELNKLLERKNKEMQQFIYTVSHDLKAPLVTISGFSRSLIKELSGKLAERQSHRLQRIHDNITQMEQLLADLLALSRVAHNDIDIAELDIESIALEQCESLEALINKAKATVNIHKPLHMIRANKRLVSQCLSNLLANAVHYRDLHRPLVIDISTAKNDSGIVLSVQDNGIGIDKKYHERIFKIFERLSKGKGTGVGLTIVKTIMEKHGGHVILDSEVGKGSRFDLCFVAT